MCGERELAPASKTLSVPRRTVDHPRVMGLVRDLLAAIGYDPADPGIADTPRRVADWWREFLEYDPGKVGTVFEQATNGQMVMVTGMRVWSLCEHHLLPFWCDVSVAYIPAGSVLGLSKFGRIAHGHAHGLQLQERLVAGIADDVARLTGSNDVAVLGRGEHLCMTMRGIGTPHRMVSTAFRGAFDTDPSQRGEFLRLAES